MDKKTLIYEAGINVISKNGFFNTKVQNIVDCAGVSVGSFYNYFKDKNDLLFYIFELRMSKLANYLSKLTSTPLSPTEKIDSYLDFVIEYDSKNTELEIVIRENYWYFLKLLPENSSCTYLEIANKLQGTLVEIITEGQNLNLIKNTNPQVAYNIINSIIFNYLGFCNMDNAETVKNSIKNFIRLAYYIN